MFDRQNVEVDHYLFVVTAHYHEVNRLAGVDVELLMRHKRCEIDKISGTYLPYSVFDKNPHISQGQVASVMAAVGFCGNPRSSTASADGPRRRRRRPFSLVQSNA